MRLMILPFLATLALVACGDSEPDDGTDACGSEYPPPASLDAAYTECVTDEDCVVLELGLCDQCNGGEAVAVNGARELDVADRYSECVPDTENWACTEMACPPLSAACDVGTCTLQQAMTF